MRTATITRTTRETDIALQLNLEGSGQTSLNTGVGFFDHMLDALSRFALVDLTLTCRGDTQVDYHHTVEDMGIALGRAFAAALGDMRGITRYGSMILPMDEVLMICAVDLSGRSALGYQVQLPSARVGDFDTELAKEFWLGFVRSCPCSLHFQQMAGENTHHILEACFKGMGRALAQAVRIDEAHKNEVPSTKGVLVE